MARLIRRTPHLGVNLKMPFGVLPMLQTLVVVRVGGVEAGLRTSFIFFSSFNFVKKLYFDNVNSYEIPRIVEFNAFIIG